MCEIVLPRDFLKYFWKSFTFLVQWDTHYVACILSVSLWLILFIFVSREHFYKTYFCRGQIGSVQHYVSGNVKFPVLKLSTARTGQQQEAARPMESSQEEMGTSSGWAKGPSFMRQCLRFLGGCRNRQTTSALSSTGPFRFQGANGTEPLKPRDTTCTLVRSR